MPLTTPWGEALDPAAVLQEYPRPQLVRDSYLNLNGRWEYAMRAAASPAPADGTWDGGILVPFSPEAPLSGVGRQLQPQQVLWYRRTFTLPGEFIKSRVLLHFGAVDQQCTVMVNGQEVGGNDGGYLPFTLDITAALADGGAVQELRLRVRDLSDTGSRSRGKQRLDRGGIWYTAQSGIWQTVWLESVPGLSIRDLVLTADLEALTVTVHTDHDGAPFGAEPAAVPGARAEITVSAGGRTVATAVAAPGQPVRIQVPDPHPWTPEDPFLYDLSVVLRSAGSVDRVTSYAGLRTFGTGPDASGRTRLLLNGRPVFHAGLLDQGYWPDGLYTAPSDAALAADIQAAKELGFNMLRKHIKIEPLRWYYHCDRLGMLVWQDLVNGGGQYRGSVAAAPAIGARHLEDHRHREFARADEAGRDAFLAELHRTVRLLRNCTSLAVWVPFNEGWGQFDANRVAALLRGLDPERSIDHASGWHDQGGGDIKSVHVYFAPFRLRPGWLRDGRAVVLSEYGGYSLRIPGHTFNDKEYGYRSFRTAAALKRAYFRLQARQIAPAAAAGLAAAVYTQLTDVEDEVNGLLTYDRRIVKIDAGTVRRLNARLRQRLSQDGNA